MTNEIDDLIDGRFIQGLKRLNEQTKAYPSSSISCLISLDPKLDSIYLFSEISMTLG